MRRMTPAKLLILTGKNMDRLRLEEMPLAALKCMFYNANRSHGDASKGEAPAEFIDDIYKFATFRKKRTLAAKDEVGPGDQLNLRGAKADRAKWVAWAQGQSKQVVRIQKL